MAYFFYLKEDNEKEKKEIKIDHTKETFLSNYINKFRKALGIKDLDVDTLHYLLNSNKVQKNENGVYNKSDLEPLLKNPSCPRMQRMLQTYNDAQHGKTISLDTRKKEYPIDGEYYDYDDPIDNKSEEKEEIDYTFWKDGKDMDDANKILLQKYMDEAKQPIEASMAENKSRLDRIITENIRKYLL